MEVAFIVFGVKYKKVVEEALEFVGEVVLGQWTTPPTFSIVSTNPPDENEFAVRLDMPDWWNFDETDAARELVESYLWGYVLSRYPEFIQEFR